ncbi:MAG: STAS domain-containing protein [Armatimonadota bacterium]
MGTGTWVNVTVQDGVPMIQVLGDLDHQNVDEFRNALSGLANQGHRFIIVDVSGVSFMDSGGLSGIVFAVKRLTDADGHLSVAGCNPRLSRRLHLGGLTKMSNALSLHRTTTQALEEIKKLL